MTTLAHVRTALKRLPEVEQGTHVGMESWSVAGHGFLTVTKERDAIRLRLPAEDTEQVLRDIPGSTLVTRGDAVLGVSIGLEAMNGMQANAVIGRSWAHRAPKRLTKAATASSGGDTDLPPGRGRPAASALRAAGIATLADVSGHRASEIAALHGVGPKAIRLLGEALAERGLTWREPT
ncbi:MAG: hypothetical protein QM597_09040 [Aeromicrobium sp.]|uniref:hypothetical protein n=1 Tax=Aeromicrobium sp. TaxID=1871063 RepID=UPI0039E257CF